MMNTVIELHICTVGLHAIQANLMRAMMKAGVLGNVYFVLCNEKVLSTLSTFLLLVIVTLFPVLLTFT